PAGGPARAGGSGGVLWRGWREERPVMTPREPFALLGMAPTLDLAAVKRAYFDALARHPPHVDSAGFQQVRGAYEALTRPGGLAAAYLASPVDVRSLEI